MRATPRSHMSLDFYATAVPHGHISAELALGIECPRHQLLTLICSHFRALGRVARKASMMFLLAFSHFSPDRAEYYHQRQAADIICMPSRRPTCMMGKPSRYRTRIFIISHFSIIAFFVKVRRMPTLILFRSIFSPAALSFDTPLLVGLSRVGLTISAGFLYGISCDRLSAFHPARPTLVTSACRHGRCR